MYSFTLFLYILGIGFGLSIIVSFVEAFNIKKMMKITNSLDMTGKEFCEKLLCDLGLTHVTLEKSEVVDKFTSSYFNWVEKRLVLSHQEYVGNDVLAVASATHECFHVKQDNEEHFSFRLAYKNQIKANVAKFIFLPLFAILTFLFDGEIEKESFELFYITYFGSLLFHFITIMLLEYDANKKAYLYLKNNNLVTKSELKLIKKRYILSFLNYIISSPFTMFRK